MSAKYRTDRIKADAARLKAFIIDNIAYDELEGALYMRGSPRLRLPVEPADDNGKRPRVRIAGHAVLAAHVAFICKTGNWPHLAVRHLNGDEADIRWDNMQLVAATPDPEDEEMSLFMIGNERFLADLRKYHPKGPPTYHIKAGKPVVLNQYNPAITGYGGGAAAMCADAL